LLGEEPVDHRHRPTDVEAGAALIAGDAVLDYNALAGLKPTVKKEVQYSKASRQRYGSHLRSSLEKYTTSPRIERCHRASRARRAQSRKLAAQSLRRIALKD